MTKKQIADNNTRIIREFVEVATGDRWTSKAQRLADLTAAGYPANERKAIALIRSPLLKLRAQIHKAIEPQLAAMRRWDEFIHSGHSTFQDFLKSEMAIAENQDKQTGSRPALPSNVPMPANKCLAPRINL